MSTNLLEEYRRRAYRLSRSEFLKSVSGHYLLGEVTGEEVTGEPGFHTGVFSLDILKKEHERQQQQQRSDTLRKGPFLFRVGKRAHAEWLSWISLGRASNTDVMLRHPSVSKVHARLDSRPPPPPEAETGQPEFFLTDIGSSRGTWVNDQGLPRNKSVPLKPGDRVRFGDIEAVFLDAAGLYNQLRRLR